MIIRPRPPLWKLFFILKGSIITDIVGQLVGVSVLSLLVVAAHHRWPGWVPSINGAPFALVGIALSIFLGFRNNACYDRWWEARRQWGELIAVSRHFARQTLVLEDAKDGLPVRSDLVRLVIAFAHALRAQLRAGGPDGDRWRTFIPDRFKTEVAGMRRPTDACLRMISGELARLRAEGTLSDILYQSLDQSVGRMGLVQAACERISNTPVPFAYTLLLHRTAYLFCVLLPFGFQDSLGWFTPVASAIVAYAFFGLDALSEHLETPFETNPNGLALQAMTKMIESNLRESLGEKDVDPQPLPIDFLLM
jgi:putative membrane protein